MSHTWRRQLCTAVYAGLEAVLLLQLAVHTARVEAKDLSLVVNTWAFTDATQRAWEVIQSGASALDAIEQVCPATTLPLCVLPARNSLLRCCSDLLALSR